eukprot:tig00020848_g14622.t1
MHASTSGSTDAHASHPTLTAVHGAPYTGKTWLCLDRLEPTTRRVAGKPPHVEKRDALRLLEAGERNVLLDDGALAPALLKKIADEAAARVPKAYLQLYAVRAAGGELQSHWAREWAISEAMTYGEGPEREPALACRHALAAPYAPIPEGASTADIEAWPASVPGREEVGMDVVDNAPCPIRWTAPHAPGRPGLFVDPDALLELRRGLGASAPRPAALAALAAWAPRFPSARPAPLSRRRRAPC